MRKHITKLLLGKAPLKDQRSVDVIGSHLSKIQRVWNSEDYEDYGLERIFRLILITSKLLFLGLYFEHLTGKISRANKRLFSEFYVVFKAILPYIILSNNLAQNPVLQFLNIYFLLETFVFIFNRIFVSEHFLPEGYRRSLLLLFFSFAEVVLAFAVIYSSGNYLNQPVDNYIDAIYFSMMTSATIGYGDIHPINETGKLIAMSQALTSLAFIILFFNFFNSKIQD